MFHSQHFSLACVEYMRQHFMFYKTVYGPLVRTYVTIMKLIELCQNEFIITKTSFEIALGVQSTY